MPYVSCGNSGCVLNNPEHLSAGDLAAPVNRQISFGLAVRDAKTRALAGFSREPPILVYGIRLDTDRCHPCPFRWDLQRLSNAQPTFRRSSDTKRAAHSKVAAPNPASEFHVGLVAQPGAQSSSCSAPKLPQPVPCNAARMTWILDYATKTQQLTVGRRNHAIFHTVTIVMSGRSCQTSAGKFLATKATGADNYNATTINVSTITMPSNCPKRQAARSCGSGFRRASITQTFSTGYRAVTSVSRRLRRNSAPASAR